jgi:serine/threonine protein kinase/tetratricopeptide (TPR) repeat protein
VEQTREITEELRLKKVLKTAPQTTVFQAVDPDSGKEVAVKLISPAGGRAPAASRERFYRTMQALQSLRIQSCPDLLDFGFTPDGSAFMVMELISGAVLESYAGLPAARTIPLLMRLLGALEVLAAEQIYHHNLRPDNLLVTQGPGSESVVLLGLGSAAYLVNEEGRPQLDLTREVKLYSAPERLDPRLPLPQEGWRSDIYSAAMVICRMLEARVMAPASEQPRIDLTRQQGRLGSSERLTVVLSLALQRDPGQRQLTYSQLRDALGLAMPAKAAGADERTERIVLAQHLPSPEPQPPAPRPPARPAPAPPPAAPAQPAAPTRPPAPAAPREVTSGYEMMDSKPTVPTRRTDLAGQPRPASTPPAGMPQHPAPGPSPGDAPPTIHLEVPEHLPPPVPPQAARSAPPPVPPQAPEPAFPPLEPEPPLAAEPAFPPLAPEPLAPPPEPPPLPKTDLDITGSSLPQPDVPEIVRRKPDIVPEKVPERPTPKPKKPAKPKAKPKPKPKPKAKAKAKGKGMDLSQNKVLVAGVAAAAVVMLVIGILAATWVIGLISGDKKPPPVQPTAIPATPTPAPTPDLEPPPIHPQLELAEQLILEGDIEATRKELEKITPEEIEQFTDDEAFLYQELMASVAVDHVAVAADDLRAGLGQGNIDLVRQALMDLSGADAGKLTELQDEMALARQAVKTNDELLQAQRDDNHLQVLELAGRLITLLPKHGASYSLRDQAATALETRAEASFQARRYDEAIDQLQAIHRVWPTRPGLAQRINQYSKKLETTSQLERVLQTAEAKAVGGDPEGALTQLGRVQPTAAFQERYAAARSRYSAQLAKLDSGTPRVTLTGDFQLKFKKNQTVRIPFTITDDYRVASAKVMVKTASRPTYSEIELEHTSGSSYVFEVSPSVHGNKSVEFYVIATDRSGHNGYLGSKEDPLVLKKKWGL